MSSAFSKSRLLLPVAALLLGGAGAQEPPPPNPASPAEGAPPSAPAPAPEPAPPQWSKISPLGQGPDWSRLEAFQNTLTRKQFEEAWSAIYASGSVFPPPFRMEDGALVIPTGNPASPEVRIAFKTDAADAEPPARFWRRAAELPPLHNRPPLSDLHIAIDPGHIGGAYARMEERYLSFQPGEAIQEGDLSLLTAQVLAERLRELGASVSLVRDKLEPVTDQRPENLELAARQVLKEAGVTAPAATYDGLTGDAKILTVRWQAEKLFYRVSEIHARAAKVNQQLKPDLVLCLHFNAMDWGAAETPRFSPVNHLHVLVNGCYAPVELEQQDVRFEMFLRLFNGVHREEVPVATAVAESMARATGLPPYVYTTPNAKKAGGSAYVYARNLLANRLYQCPVVYLEPYVMNHEETYRRLLLGHFIGRTLVAGRLQTSAIEDYVNGVVSGLLAYYPAHRRSS
jgi:N-acetylmuramoyl-L-alanine amidase